MSLATRFEQGKYGQVWRTVWLLGPTRANSRPNSHNMYINNVYKDFYPNQSIKFNGICENAKHGTRNWLRAPIDLGYDLLNTKSIDCTDTKRWQRTYRCLFVLLTRSWVPFRLTALFPLLFLLVLRLLFFLLNKRHSIDNVVSLN